jgi:putative two-component system response regulator
MRFAREVGPIILGHHENWDGSGYPQGLRGQDIPIGARIITIVDAYDAMTTDRPYRKALSLEEVVRRLCASRGTQFDPQTLDIFLDLLASGRLAVPEND